MAVVLFVRSRSDDEVREPRVSKIQIDGRPSAVTSAADRVWVADDERHAVHVIDPEVERAVGDPIRVDRNPVALAGDAANIWVAHASGSVVRIATRDREADEPLDVGGSLTGIAITTGRVWATDHENGELVEIDSKRSVVRDRFELPNGAVRVAADGETLWVTGNESTVTRFDTGTKTVEPAIEVGLGPIGLAVEGGRVWVANSDDDSIRLVEGAERAERAVAVGDAPVAAAVGGATVWIANQDGRSLSRVDRVTGKTVGSEVGLGMNPRGVSIGPGGTVWVVGTNPSLLVGVNP